jgi:hypothetical protein
MKRRTVLQLLVTTLGALASRTGLRAQAVSVSHADADRIRVLGDVVLPQEIGTERRAQVVAGFLAWLQDYRPNVDTDHGYGFPRLRRTAPSPAPKYPAQLDALDAEARKRGRADFRDTTRDLQHAIVEASIAAAKIERLPIRPDGGHIATDLMGFFFHSVEANDLCYRVRIGRDTCRTLTGSDDRPAGLGPREA